MKQEVVIEIRGGTFVGFYAKDPDLHAYLVDWDEIRECSLTAAAPTVPDTLEAMPADTRKVVASARSHAARDAMGAYLVHTLGDMTTLS